jgi:anti-sigma factor RsiW
MNDFNDNTTCSRTDDLISVLYGEASESEASEFRVHMQTCASCEAEMRAFGGVRESIGKWKFEALAVAPAPEVLASAQRRKTKSAMAALREFFDLSPLWLKGATAFATLLFCLLAVLAFVKFLQPVSTTAVNNKPNAVYTEQEKDEILKKALAEQREQFLATSVPAPESVKPITVNQPQKKTVNRSNSTNVARGQRPLTKWEREQLAADLRLLQRDDAEIELLSEPINK